MALPNPAPSPDSAKEDLDALATPPIVRSAGLALLATGAFGVLHVAQLADALRYVHGPFAIVPYLMAVESVVAVFVGVAFVRARRWAPIAAIVTSALSWITSGAWFMFAMGNGLFTLFGMLVPGLAMGALLLGVMAKRPCERTVAARARLGREGLDLGV